MRNEDIKPGTKCLVANFQYGRWTGHTDSVERLTPTQIVTALGSKFYKDDHSQVGFRSDPWNGGAHIYFEDDPEYPRIVRALTLRNAQTKAYHRMDKVRSEQTPEAIDAAISALEAYRAILVAEEK